MRFWTIQPAEISERMQRGESVRVDPDHAKYKGRRPWQYEWLASALSRHGHGFDGGWPWWLSCTEPDLDRARSARHPGGPEQSIIALELPDDRCAVFPLWIWETIYCGQYVSASREALDRWLHDLHAAVPDRGAWPLPEPWRTRLEASWLAMFDPHVEPRCWYRDGDLPDEGDPMHILMRDASDGLAGLTQELRASDAVNITRFQGAD